MGGGGVHKIGFEGDLASALNGNVIRRMAGTGYCLQEYDRTLSARPRVFSPNSSLKAISLVFLW